MVVVGGLRYDYYDSRASRPFATDPRQHATRSRAISTMPGFDPDNPDRAVRAGREPRLPEPARAGVVPGHRPDQLPALLRAPGAGAGLRRCCWAGINTDLDNTNTNQVYGSDLDFGKTIAFEFGIRHAFNDDMVLDIAAYNKDMCPTRPAGWSALSDPAAEPRPTSGC